MTLPNFGRTVARMGKPLMSGLDRQLRAVFAENTSRALRGESHGPRSFTEFREWLRDSGREAVPETVRKWRLRLAEPSSGYVALMERLIGAPWIVIDDPTRPPVTREQRLAFWSTHGVAEREVERASSALPTARGRQRRR